MNKEASHHEYYSQFITESTKRYILQSLTVKDIKNALESGDEHLNKIKIPYNNLSKGGGWWWDNAPINKRLIKESGGCLSPSTHTCVSKAAARELAKTKK